MSQADLQHLFSYLLTSVPHLQTRRAGTAGQRSAWHLSVSVSSYPPLSALLCPAFSCLSAHNTSCQTSHRPWSTRVFVFKLQIDGFDFPPPMAEVRLGSSHLSQLYGGHHITGPSFCLWDSCSGLPISTYPSRKGIAHNSPAQALLLSAPAQNNFPKAKLWLSGAKALGSTLAPPKPKETE